MNHDLIVLGAGVLIGIAVAAVLAIIAVSVMKERDDLPKSRDWHDAEYEQWRIRKELEAQYDRKPLV